MWHFVFSYFDYFGKRRESRSCVIANLQLDHFRPAQHVESDRKRYGDLILRLWHLLCLLDSQVDIVLPVIVGLSDFSLVCLKHFYLT